jgi:hypothetical protein
MKAAANDRLTYMSDIVSCLKKLETKGFTDHFSAKGTHIFCLNNEKVYYPADIDVLNYYRFEGPSNPEDMAILYAVETNDGRRGTLIDAYGYYACEEVGDFMIEVEKIQKKIPTHNWKSVIHLQ